MRQQTLVIGRSAFVSFHNAFFIFYVAVALGLFSQQRLAQKLLKLVFINIIVKNSACARFRAHLASATRAHAH